MALSAVLEFVGEYWWLLIGLLGVGLLAYLWTEEREKEGSTVEGVGNRLDDLFAMGLGGFASLVVVVLSIVITIGDQLAMLGEQLLMVASNGPPLLLVNIAGAIIGALGLAGVVDVTAGAYVLGAAVLLLVGVAWRRRRAAA